MNHRNLHEKLKNANEQNWIETSVAITFCARKLLQNAFTIGPMLTSHSIEA
jgi:hypothetical protein